MPFNVLIATRSFGSTSQKPWDVLAEAGIEVVRADMTGEMSEERLIELLNGVDGAVVGVVPMTAKVMENSPQLKVVSMHGVGVDHIDLDAAVRLNIIVANCPGANDQAVADLALGLMIAVARQITKADQSLRSLQWGRYSGSELWKKTLGLVGFGRIGRGVARRALGFDMQVLVYDPYISADQVDISGVSLTTLEEVLLSSDFLSIHAALTEETRSMIGEAQFRLMKPTAYLINTARGGLIDEAALYNALVNGQIAGAALDVFIQEPPWSSTLLGLENLLLTPHIGAHTQEAIERMGVMAAQNVVLTLQGGQPLHRVR
ncbi:MAG: phosphoglycerate dehydrogenase [Anaerolineales bacterium]